MEDIWTYLAANWVGYTLTGIVAGIVISGALINFLRTAFKSETYPLPSVGDIFLRDGGRWKVSSVYPIKNASKDNPFMYECKSLDQENIFTYVEAQHFMSGTVRFFNTNDRVATLPDLPENRAE